MYKGFIKKFIDLLAALFGLVLCSPVLLVLVIVLIFVNKGKPFFYQNRAGYKGTIFKIIKIKTMNDKTDAHGNLLPFNERLTKIGAFIRNYSLDEIPQLFNVLKGDMSIVGPRPLYPEYLPLYNETQSRRHDVMPGITGWAQVNGRNSITWEEKFDYDIWYVDNQNFMLDMKILWLTFYKVIKKKDINSSETTNMPLFTGTKVDDQ